MATALSTLYALSDNAALTSLLRNLVISTRRPKDVVSGNDTSWELRSSWSSRMMTAIALATLGRQSCPLRLQCEQNKRKNVQRASVMPIPHASIARLICFMRFSDPEPPGG